MDKTSVGEKKRVISKKYLRPRWNFLSQDRKGVLHINNVSVNDLEKNYGTPLYIMVENEIRDRLRRFKAAFNTYEKLVKGYLDKYVGRKYYLQAARWMRRMKKLGFDYIGIGQK